MPPKPLWSALETFERRLEDASQLWLATDFDGTLAPIVRRPELAEVLPGSRRALSKLARLPRSRVALVSGRRLSDLSRRAGVSGAFLAGLLGIETREPARPRRVHLSPGEKLPRALIADLRRLCLEYPGTWVEPKGWAAAVHYRELVEGRGGPFGAGVRKRVHAHRDTTELAVAKKAFEIRPRGAPGKADTLGKWLGREVTGRLVVFIGDDALDEEAHGLVRRRGGIGILVGRRVSNASYRLDDPGQVARFLEWLEAGWRAKVLPRGRVLRTTRKTLPRARALVT